MALFPALEAKPASGANQETSVIIVNERTLVGPNSSVQLRGGRLFLPVATIAQALGDTFSSDSTTRIVTIRRQTGTIAIFNAPLNEVRENGAVILTVSGTADLIFPPTPNELMLPAEIVAALLDVTVRRDERNAVVTTRRGIQAAETIRPGAKQARFELFQLEYDYNYSRYTEAGDHSLVLRGTGRVGDARLSFIANSVMGVTRNSSRPSLQGGTIRLDRPNGQSFVGGEFGTGTDVEFLSAAVRGGLVQLPLHRVRLDFFGGQTTSGVPTANLNLNSFSPLDVRYDTKILGAIATTATRTPRQRDFTLSAGAMHFGGSSRKGDMVAGGLKYVSGLNRFQADLAMGQFSGIGRDGTLIKGTGAAASFTGSYNLTDAVLVQARYTHVGQTFLSPQSGIHSPTSTAAAGVSWQPRRWFTAGLSGSTATTPGRRGDFNRYVTASLTLAPENSLPAFFVSHTQTSTTQLRNSAFTLITATKKFNRWNMFFNGSRIQTFGDTALNAQVGGNIRVNEANTLEVSQSLGSNGLLTGMAMWQMSNLFSNRLAFSAGLGYTRSSTAPFQTSQHMSASLKLPRSGTLQFSYLKTVTGTTALLSLRGLLFSSRRAERAINGTLADMNSYGVVSGKVYQDVNLNGRFDPGIDQPQANAQVRVDGSRYVVSDANGNYRIDNIARGDHAVYLDLLSVRADLTLLDNTQQLITLDSKRDVMVDFRVVRTGRISGVVWMDINENGKLDETEQPLPDVRVVTGSGRDTLTDEKGYFNIGDLPPGEHIVLLDEKTIPERTRSITGSQTIKVTAANETTTTFPVTPLPDQIKKFPKN
ncbi:MAG TPA: SdrD B-like domain-containing protein [Pyrinomonadaceae bacterium]|nr:SdrD B-like domain-containing protein [Pyrinomonadaceae bacterium]